MQKLHGFWKEAAKPPVKKASTWLEQHLGKKYKPKPQCKKGTDAKRKKRRDRALAKLQSQGMTKLPKRSPEYTDGDKFYSSREWKELRYLALKTYGPKCQCCGATPQTGAIMQVDHIQPRWTHPELQFELSNMQILCDACNSGKGAWDSSDWREHFKSI